MNEPKIHLENIHPSAPPKKKNTKKKPNKKQEEKPSSRKIPFKRRWFQNGLTVFFYTLFITLTLVLLMTYGRLDTIVDVANSKAIDPNDLTTSIKAEQKEGDLVAYDGKKWLQTFFSNPSEDKAVDERLNQLKRNLASGVDVNFLSNTASDVKRDGIVVDVVNQQVTTEEGKKSLYRTVYDVRFQENGQTKETEIALYAVYQSGQSIFIQIPEYLNTKENKAPKTSVENKEDYFTKKGTELDADEKQKVEAFSQKFLELYCKNDPNLYLISAVQGLDGGTLQNATITNVVKNGKEITVQGTYTFTFTENAPQTSYFTFQMRQNKDSYFVNNMNN
ncbi:conjugal transfer protein [Listeria sp. FSL L7-1509]|uniref:Conjugal transfer protein n=2 Tax=Listeria immobilis TaxID=2713502 RepID=A0ABR6T005_9LIST|nr:MULTISPECIES: conjugal transfer protein [Listeria]MBC1483995.1 conjugal transfer protein [Listeria immobilis]MBC1508165.1 conjugal transfer protein [Listeria immobilis]MBC1511172.1 conjugal transfer protein [Listeria immobilis]MBC1839539.1 conjugal transfer protein [Listeria seeligeri]MBC6313671.1 conjugal transfer protein [Listeria immobilis]